MVLHYIQIKLQIKFRINRPIRRFLLKIYLLNHFCAENTHFHWNFSFRVSELHKYLHSYLFSHENDEILVLLIRKSSEWEKYRIFIISHVSSFNSKSPFLEMVLVKVLETWNFACNFISAWKKYMNFFRVSTFTWS